MLTLLADLRGAIALLTRLHVPGHATSRGAWAWPVVGGLVGGLTGLAWFALRRLGLPAAPVAWLVLGCGLLLTGALHEDGLADVADGFGGGASRARKLEIMHDSHIGTYGVAALVVVLAVRATSLAAIADPAWGWRALVMAGALGRAAMCLPLLLSRPARADGLGAALGPAMRLSAVAGLCLGAVPAFLLWPAHGAALAVAAAWMAGLGMAWLAQRQIGGHSGDVFGAAEMLAECAVLVTLCA